MKAALTAAEGKTQTIAGKAGEVRWRPATQHRGAVLGEKPVEQILVEMKAYTR